MDSDETVLAMVQVISPFAQVKIEDADGIDLRDVPIGLALVDMFRNGFGYAIQDAFQIICLAGILHFDQDNLSLGILCLDIHPVVLVPFGLLVPFAFQDLHDLHRLTEEDGQEPFQHTKVSLLPEQTLDGPIESDIQVSFFCHSLRFFNGLSVVAKLTIICQFL